MRSAVNVVIIDTTHLGATCPTKGQGTKCFECKKYGHIAAKCPESENAEKKKNCNMIQFDSGKCRKDVVMRSD